MKQFEYVIADPEGIHARPAGMLVKKANEFTSNIEIKKGGRTGDAKRIFSIMALAAKQGETIKVTVNGPDEAEAAEAMQNFLKENL